MIDTHSHIYLSEYEEDRDEVVARAREAGLTHILLPNVNLDSIEPMLSLCRRHPDFCFPMMGLHPEDVTADYQSVLDEMRRRLAEQPELYVAIGEVGLDFHFSTEFRDQQFEALEQQISWAREFHLPLVLHVRDAHNEMIEVLHRHDGESLTGIFHCFGGTLEQARELLQFPGFVLGIGGILTFKKSPLPEVVRNVPLDRLVLETDCPWLAPVPHRGQRNESAYVADVLRRLAEEVGRSPEEVDKVTTSTVLRLFPGL